MLSRLARDVVGRIDRKDDAGYSGERCGKMDLEAVATLYRAQKVAEVVDTGLLLLAGDAWVAKRVAALGQARARNMAPLAELDMTAVVDLASDLLGTDTADLDFESRGSVKQAPSTQTNSSRCGSAPGNAAANSQSLPTVVHSDYGCHIFDSLVLC